VPLFDSQKLGKANLNLAGRGTHYSTSGTVYTWKIGGTWQTPIDGIRLRAVTSRDVRAPNLSELYAAPITITVPGITNPTNNQSVIIQQNTIGNSALKPEIARNTEAGIVLSRPHWAPGLSLSFDYYRIKMTGVISALSAQQEINYCSAGVTQLCSAFNLTAATPYANVQSFNLASIFTDGFDIEASYRFNLDSIKLPGSLTLRAGHQCAQLHHRHRPAGHDPHAGRRGECGRHAALEGAGHAKLGHRQVQPEPDRALVQRGRVQQ
jgi:outer membrane receptor protein involved in Fe transport